MGKTDYIQRAEKIMAKIRGRADYRDTTHGVADFGRGPIGYYTALTGRSRYAILKYKRLEFKYYCDRIAGIDFSPTSEHNVDNLRLWAWFDEIEALIPDDVLQYPQEIVIDGVRFIRAT